MSDNELTKERRATESSRETLLEIKARATEDMLERALTANKTVAWTWNLESGRFLRSKNAPEVLGVANLRHLGRGLTLVHPSDRASYKATLREAVRSRGSFKVVFRIVRPRDGKIAWMEESGRFLEGDGPRTIVGLCADVTERQASEQRRRVEHETLRLLSRRASLAEALRSVLQFVGEEFKMEAGAAWQLDELSDVLKPVVLWETAESRRPMSGKWQALRSRRGEGLVGFAWARGRASWIPDLTAYQNLPRADAALKRGFRCALAIPIFGRRRIIGAFELFGKAVEPLTAQNMETLEGLGRQLGQFVERRRAEDALRRKRREEQIILDTVPAMIWYKDRHNRILRCNRAAARWVGREQSEIEGSDTAELFPEKAAQYQASNLAVMRSGKPALGLFEEGFSPSGSRCWLRRDVIPYEGASGRVIGVIVFVMDVTAHKRAELLEQERERQREFLANVSHEFRTPIAAIKGFSETLLDGALDDQKQRGNFVRIIGRHAERLGGLVEDLLTLAALDRGLALRHEAVDVAHFVREHLAGLAPVLKRKAIKPILSLQVASAKVDPIFFRHVLDNLISNAVKFSRPNSRIWVEAGRVGGNIRLSVRDEGIGISADALPQVFDRFFRVEGKPERGNSGLGLNIVKRIVEAHGGRVWAQSRLGRGSTFHVSLPLISGGPDRSEPKSQAVPTAEPGLGR